MFLTDFMYASRPTLYKLTLPYTTFFQTHKTTMLRLNQNKEKLSKDLPKS